MAAAVAAEVVVAPAGAVAAAIRTTAMVASKATPTTETSGEVAAAGVEAAVPAAEDSEAGHGAHTVSTSLASAVALSLPSIAIAPAAAPPARVQRQVDMQFSSSVHGS